MTASKNIFISPEFTEIESKIDLEKSCVYSLGLILLQIQNLREIPMFKNEHQIQHYIKKEVDNPVLSKIIHKMLKFEQKKRSNFNELFLTIFEEQPSNSKINKNKNFEEVLGKFSV